MKDCVIISMAIGLVVGALLVTNNQQVREYVEKGKSAVKEQLQKMK